MKGKSLEDIGEFGLIEIIKKKFNIKNNSSIVGIGDDSAVIFKSKDDHFIISSSNNSS